MSTITNGKYADFSNDVKTLIDQANKIYVNIYTDSSVSTFALDHAGNNIERRLLTSMNYTYPHTNDDGNAVEGTFILTFIDGGSITILDSETNYWFDILDVDEFGPKPLI